MCGCGRCPTGGIGLKTLGHEHSLKNLIFHVLTETQQKSEISSNPKGFWQKNPQIRGKIRRILNPKKLSYAFSMSEMPLSENSKQNFPLFSFLAIMTLGCARAFSPHGRMESP